MNDLIDWLIGRGEREREEELFYTKWRITID